MFLPFPRGGRAPPSVHTLPADSLPPVAPPSKRVCTRPAADASTTDLPSVQSLLNPGLDFARSRQLHQSSKYKRSPSSPNAPDTMNSNRQQHTRRREQCRTNQQRYRDKQKFAVLRLEADVLQLRQAIKYHEVARDASVVGGNAVAECVSQIVTEFFAMFRFGLSGASLALPIRPHTVQVVRSGQAAPSENASVTLLAPANADDQIVRSVLPQLAFLRTAFASDVEFGGLRGLDAFVEQLWRYSCYFSNVRLELERIQLRPRADENSLHDSAFVLATGTLTLAISPATLTHVFPLVERDEWITSRLLGKKLDCACEASFEFGRQGCQYQVTQVNMKLDLMAALRVALGRLDAVAVVLGRALVSPEGPIGDLRDHPSGSSYDDI